MAGLLLLSHSNLPIVSCKHHPSRGGEGVWLQYDIPARPLRGVTKCHQASTWDNCIVRRVRNGCTMEDSMPFCTLCGISLPLSSKRSTMSTSDEAPSSFYKRALFLTRELRVIITGTVLLLVISHARRYITGSSGMSYCNQTPFPPCEGWGLGTRLSIRESGCVNGSKRQLYVVLLLV